MAAKMAVSGLISARPGRRDSAELRPAALPASSCPAAVRAVLMIVREVFSTESLQVFFVQRNHVIQ
jgi:hypothetical protein